MGFLHGVLEAVKNENEVTTYDKYISDHNKNLKSVLDTLTKNIGSGRAGLVESVGAVKEWLEGYGREVEEKINRVKNLLEQLKSGINDALQVRQNMNNYAVDQQQEWSSKIAHILIGSAEQAMKAAKHLDQNLKNKLVKYIEFVIQAVSNFCESAKNEDMKKVVKSVEAERLLLLSHSHRIRDDAESTVNSFIEMLEQNINKLDGQIVIVARNISSAENELNGLIKTADEAHKLGKDSAAKLGTLDTKLRSELQPNIQHIPFLTMSLGVKTTESELFELLKHIDAEIVKLATNVNTLGNKNFNGFLSKMKSDLEALHATIDDLHSTAQSNSLLRPTRQHFVESARRIKIIIENVSKSLMNDVDETLRKLEKKVETLQSTFEEDKQSLDELAKQISGTVISDILKESTALKEKNKGLPKINGLISGIKLRLNTIHQHVIDMQSANVSSNMRNVQRHFKVAKQNAIKDIAEIARKLELEINKVSYTVYETARETYHASKVAELKGLQSFVEKQKSTIEHIIYTDKMTGVKGLMRILNIALKSRSFSDMTIMNELVYKLLDVFKLFFHELMNQADLKESADAINTIYFASKYLFDKMFEEKHFHTDVTKKLDAFSNVLSVFHPETMDGAPKKVLTPLKQGFGKFVDQLDKAYVSRYSGAKQISWEAHLTTAQTEESKNCAKVFLTIAPTLFGELTHLRAQCASNYPASKIHATSGPGVLLKRMGYGVATDKSAQDGHLQNSDDMRGEKIVRLLQRQIQLSEQIAHSPKCVTRNTEKFNTMDVLDCVFKHVDEYNAVCHTTPVAKPRTPCSIFEMLGWFCGLPYNSVHTELISETLYEYLENPNKPDKDDEEGFEIEIVDHKSLYLQAYPHDITYNAIVAALTDICSTSYDIMATVVGTGDEYTMYGCDYSNNTLGLYYPQSGDDCLHMILDLLRRLFPALQYIRVQCKVATKHGGWADCAYGKSVSPANWPSEDHSTNEPKSQPNDQPKMEPKCQPKSPLMSYLNDCLPGHMPHQVSSTGCKSKCSTCPRNVPGMPCLTPLGFRGFSGSMKKGSDLGDILQIFFDIRHLTTLLALAPRPPSTLPELFGFALSLVGGWKHGAEHPIKTVIESSIRSVSINLVPNAADITDALTDAYGSTDAHHKDCEDSHLITLSSSAVCYGKNKRIDCAPYISTLWSDAYSYLPHKHADLYLSWAVYSPWNFWHLLENLYNEFCNIFCQDWGCHSCMQASKCKRGKHGHERSSCSCSSIVSCKGVSPTLYRFGFRLGDAAKLNSSNAKKVCYNFQKQFSRVIKSKYFTVLFNKCDDLLFQIRAPFIWLNVALWLLSLLYLLHIMVIRLDLLHIKSHLHSPSSHRIAAQSLLAAGRVNKLNRVFYLQP
ncbi:hypothetical protein BBBOND_0313840 [Babesia bigemina]|uniref:C3H1-type domain-containing protein n=1 Tax=Babesia bigemina TaxID=5866 RepID=A0A061DBX4_BABBI|nr:hypothetical protein BBBOND_0313840 [Babesia bigemina]CDR97482.1 hypothetical protein BBBOND_0313840 [Babesia bigemina]|eukprot:XP_012769668.1 hypothetical protein BBBOND_0313840 [Babesia bigemina]